MKRIGANIRKVKGGYLSKFIWPYGNTPGTLGEAGSPTFVGLLKTLVAASSGFILMPEERARLKDLVSKWETEKDPLGGSLEHRANALSPGTQILSTMRSVNGGFVATFPKDPEEEMFFANLEGFLRALVGFNYVLPPDSEESK